jgi:hypothetical protein
MKQLVTIFFILSFLFLVSGCGNASPQEEYRSMERSCTNTCNQATMTVDSMGLENGEFYCKCVYYRSVNESVITATSRVIK